MSALDAGVARAELLQPVDVRGAPVHRPAMLRVVLGQTMTLPTPPADAQFLGAADRETAVHPEHRTRYKA
ncbi:MAG TPA: hypothetical protein VF711_00410 [Acidimicrobiales bacterium]